ncbi:transposase [Streptomyces sp. SAS_270]|uniref:transposase n=1 Tax=Streptomyces sp. SAS_270 TaxID=3412748 RepID=UPI00403D040A
MIWGVRSDVSDARWTMIEPVFVVAWRAALTGPGTAARVHDLREIVNAILYVNRTGIPWEYLPHDFPPFPSVQDRLRLLREVGSGGHYSTGARSAVRQGPPCAGPACGRVSCGARRTERETLRERR